MKPKATFNFLSSILLTVALLSACSQEPPPFEKLDSSATGIHFNNIVEESDSLNMLVNEYIYNGAGVGVADFNQNGYPDLFFAGNMVDNRLYLNEGEFRFSDVTEQANLAGNLSKWYSGVSVVDINHNGLPDIYLTVTASDDPELRRNELYVHQGLDEDGIPVFKEMAEAYGLDDPSYSTHAAFFDANNNGALDMYLLVAYSGADIAYGNIMAQQEASERANTDKLLTYSWDDEKGHPVYRDVSDEAGINQAGHGLGVQIVDINKNGWKDVYVANDYISEDLFWINNGDGTFTNRANDMFKHTSYSAMGTDIGDINNNGRMDIYTLDMLPEINVRRKMMANPNNYRNYVNDAFAGYHPQYTRNTLQLNMGSVEPDGLPHFSEIALLANVDATDWSWAALLIDVDNDGYRDLFVTNGIPRDNTDKDFWDEYGRVRNIMPYSIALPKIPEVKVPNYMFKNQGNLQFKDVTHSWGFETPSYSTGVVYVDLNNNGAMDLVINNTNDNALVYRNRIGENAKKDRNHWLKLDFEGDEKNPMGLGAMVDLHFNGHIQAYEHTLYKGYISSVNPIAHFGLGTAEKIDSLVVRWPTGNGFAKEVITDPAINQTHTISRENAEGSESVEEKEFSPIFADVTEKLNVTYRHQARNFNDFHEQPLLPYKLSSKGPGMASGDLSGNGLDDLFIGASAEQAPVILYQESDGSFEQVRFDLKGIDPDKFQHHNDVLLFDANGSGRLDIYLASGGIDEQWFDFKDQLYINNGNGTFMLAEDALPNVSLNSSVAKQADFTGNGMQDLFVGSLNIPGRYPDAQPNLLLRNDSDNGQVRFTDVTQEKAPQLHDLGMVNDAVWSDFNGNGKPDLVIAGEWLPVTFFESQDNTFENRTDQYGFPDEIGWWKSIYSADLNNNGYDDYVIGNLGLNSLYRASHEEPVSVYYGDLTENGFHESLLTFYLWDEEWNRHEYPSHNREDVTRHIPELSRRFQSHQEFGLADLEEILTGEMKDNATVHRATNFSSSIIFNQGEGQFQKSELPVEAQFAPIQGIASMNLTNSKYPELLISGNLFDADIQSGSYNALNGLVLKEGEDGMFEYIPVQESGFYLPGDGRSIKLLNGPDGNKIIVAFQRNGTLRMFRKQK